MSQFDQLKDTVREILPDVDLVLGWERAYDGLRARPFRMTEEADLDKLIWDPTCVQNLTTQLMYLRGKKIGIPVKGCDSRSIVQMMQEELIDRESLVIIGLPCEGVIDLAKVRMKVKGEEALGRVEGDKVIIDASEGEVEVPLKDVLADKCRRCKYPNPLEYDHLCGEVIEPEKIEGKDPALAGIEAMTIEQRFEFWRSQMDRCIRCYACRNACPLCVCRDHCIADSREPHWQSAEASTREKWMFQLIHAMHLAGRCTECGECQRACPMDIPVLLFKKNITQTMKETFDYETGINPEATPPLFTFKADEDNIEEVEL